MQTPFKANYDSKLLRGHEEPRPWDLTAEIAHYCTPATKLLDIGTGTAKKIIPLASKVKELHALEPSPDLRSLAAQNMAAAKVKNMTLTDGRAEAIPYADSTFDIVTSIIAYYNCQEMARVLKPGGVVLMERVGERDKWNFMRSFGSDQNGPRAFMANFKEHERSENLRQEFAKHFEKIEIRYGEWKTWYTLEGLRLLFENTHMVRDFDPIRDQSILEQMQGSFSKAQGIETIQQRYLFCARKYK